MTPNSRPRKVSQHSVSTLDTFCPSVRTKCRSENQTDADTGFQHLLLPPPPPPSVEFGLSAAPSVSAQEKIQLD
ncbi:hypothetical protein F2P79_022904, partial [Pimephales promelas]